MTFRPTTAAPILAVLSVVLATLGAYVGGYFIRGNITITTVQMRPWSSYLESRIFWPAMYVEGVLCGSTVVSQYPNPPPNGGDAITTETVYQSDTP